MACATIFEAEHGTERVLATFYHAWWFKLLLCLLAVNALAALASRFPFSRRHIGFVLTHGSVLVLLAGALVSDGWAIRGQVTIGEGQSVDHFLNLDREVLSAVNRSAGAQADFPLDPKAIGGFKEIARPRVPAQSVGDLRIELLRYLPDTDAVERVVDDSPRPNCAIEVSLSSEQQGNSAWVFEGGSVSLGSIDMVFQRILDPAELTRRISPSPDTQPASKGVVRIEHEEATFEIPLEDCLERAAAIGSTGYTVRVLRYLPHATVGHDGQISNASDRPLNPFIEAELSGPSGIERRLAFARFPEFSSMHAGRRKDQAASQPALEDVKLTFVSSSGTSPGAPIEVLAGPDGRLYVRFAQADQSWTSRQVAIGEVIDTPWPGRTFAVVRRFDHARKARSAQPVAPVRDNRTPAILVKVSRGGPADEIWLRKNEIQNYGSDGGGWRLSYANEVVPLGFNLKLNRFRVGRYPGESAPRSFESHVSITDANTGREQNSIISMNQPVTYGGFLLFQSSYRQEGGTSASTLGVAWDPGQPIVFLGYVTTLVGMVVVLITRMRQRRRAGALEILPTGDEGR
jgi:hypothetical protein